MDQDVADLANEIEIVDQTLAIIPLTEKIIRRAAEAFPTVIGTLDALHLSSALLIRDLEPIDSFLTHNQQLAIAARSLGFQVIGSD